MNINRRLQRIHKNLQEVAWEMEISAMFGPGSKPKDRKGDYVRLYDVNGVHDAPIRGWLSRKYFNAQLVTKPKFHEVEGTGWWQADLVYEADEYIYEGKNFFQTKCSWEIVPNAKYWTINGLSKRKNVKKPRNWNPNV